MRYRILFYFHFFFNLESLKYYTNTFILGDVVFRDFVFLEEGVWIWFRWWYFTLLIVSDQDLLLSFAPEIRQTLDLFDSDLMLVLLYCLMQRSVRRLSCLTVTMMARLVPRRSRSSCAPWGCWSLTKKWTNWSLVWILTVSETKRKYYIYIVSEFCYQI